MTTATPSRTTTPAAPRVPQATRHLRLVREDAREFVGYLVLLPAGADPTELFARSGIRPEVHALAPTGTPRTGPPPAPESRADAPHGNAPVDAPHDTPPDALRLDAERRVAVLDGRELDLTYLEFELLAQLTGHPHRVYSREYLVGHVWGYGHVGDGRTVDVHIARLRRKFGPTHRGRIVTVRRVGYKYVPDAS
ncbi:winged helix-turn-helix domain-containing protein [Streptomyces sp. LHD-70]|uniref:winged helix-turn-helix domain-containing protein n=1 Tax=Streptomyces sp. LHD-70 TaxID=3072140 RepID=UPI00280D3A49|nr:winged helix-turn-helix domain-containing protein [Streptomyces sp. LHD-70]MDQ8702864.1 winged helix-turn-helix domain-containing protein [Streptomyces sp. LHD-70]